MLLQTSGISSLSEPVQTHLRRCCGGARCSIFAALMAAPNKQGASRKQGKCIVCLVDAGIR
jgi:hypothetical protein